MMLCVLIVLIQCAMSGKKPRPSPKYKYAQKYKKWPSEKPTEEPTSNPTDYPTLDPTPSPTFYECPSKLMDPSIDPIEYVVVVDNSCGLTQNECMVQMKEIGDTVRQIKLDKNGYFTKVAYIEFYGKGAKKLIGFEDDKYQRNAQKYYEFILEEAGCGNGGDGQSDTVAGIQYAVDEYLKNGDNDKYTKRKIIIFNNCEMARYKYGEFEDVISELKDIDNFLISPDLMIINVPSQDKPSKNSIRSPFDYLAFLIDTGSSNNRYPSSYQIYVAPSKYSNDGKITSEDYSLAALVKNRRIPDRYDLYRNSDRICEVVGKPNTDNPTAEPTEYPTEVPTENPTSNPTEIPTFNPTKPPKVCFKVDQKQKKMMNKKMGNKNKMDCMSSWSLSKKGMKRVIESGDFKDCDKSECIFIEYPLFEYVVSVERGCGKISWSVDGEECGYYDFDEFSYGKKKGANKMKKDFALKCPKSKMHSKW